MTDATEHLATMLEQLVEADKAQALDSSMFARAAAVVAAYRSRPAQACVPIGYIADWLPDALAHRDEQLEGIAIWPAPKDKTGLTPIYAGPVGAGPLTATQRAFFIRNCLSIEQAIDRMHRHFGLVPADTRSPERKAEP